MVSKQGRRRYRIGWPTQPAPRAGRPGPAIRTVECERCGGEGHQQYVHGWALKAERGAAGITMAVMAEAMGVSTTYIAMLESDKRPCSQQTYEKWNRELKRLKAR